MSEKQTASGHHTGRRIRQYLRPDGRILHIAASPEEAETLRKTLSQEQKEADFDLIIHGSPEHADAIREIRAHHEQKRDKLKSKYADAYEEIEKVHADLDALSTELSGLTEKDVALDANFSRYGYSAHIRTKEASSGENSRANSIMSPASDESRRFGDTMKFWKRPIIRQYFHKGLIWRASDKEEVASFELFVDLLYVGIIAINGDQAAEDPTGQALLQFCITFVLSWKLWTELTLVVSWFETDDIFQRICVLFFLVCLTGFTLNITNAKESTYAQLIGFYLAERLFQATYFLFTARMLPMIRGMLIASVVGILIPAALWIASIHVENPARLILIWLAIPIELFFAGIIVFFVRSSERWQGTFLDRISRFFQFYPAVNIEHKTERTNAFVTIVFGYSVVALLYQNQAAFGINAFFGKAVLGLVQAFAFNMIYFEIDNRNIYTHAIRRHYVSYTAWMWLHLPFIMSFVWASGSLSKLVIAHDCFNADPSTLADTYAARSLPELGIGLRWFYCAGLGVALACMTGISASHEHKLTGSPHITKAHRLTARFIISLILTFLPLIGPSLSSLSLIATSTSLVLFVLMLDLYGQTCVQDQFWMGNSKCKYRAECHLRKRDIEDLKGGVIGVEELARRDEGGGLGVMDMS